VDAKLSGGSGHGTKMATIAAGKTLGVAPNANLYLMKTKGQWNRASSTSSPVSDMTLSLQNRALRRIFAEIREHVRQRLEKSNTAKSVINMSWGKIIYVYFIPCYSLTPFRCRRRPSRRGSRTGRYLQRILRMVRSLQDYRGDCCWQLS
jgi:subtilisin family serine protease